MELSGSEVVLELRAVEFSGSGMKWRACSEVMACEELGVVPWEVGDESASRRRTEGEYLSIRLQASASALVCRTAPHRAVRASRGRGRR